MANSSKSKLCQNQSCDDDPDTAALVAAIGGDHVSVESLTKGSQDPHYVDAKPSFILKVARADLLVSVGLDLEIGWLPSVLSGARNSKVMPGASASLALGESVAVLDRPSEAELGRDHGDVHPGGNPHFMLDPVRAAELGTIVAQKLAELRPAHSKTFAATLKSSKIS